LFVSSQVNVTRKGAEGASEIRAMMDGLRRSPPNKIGPLRVTAFSDFNALTRTVLGNGGPTPLSFPKTNMVVFELEEGCRIIARPSGTEPKAKFYFDVREEMSKNDAFDVATARANEKARALEAAFMALAGV
jgi:phosphomannomutase